MSILGFRWKPDGLNRNSFEGFRSFNQQDCELLTIWFDAINYMIISVNSQYFIFNSNKKKIILYKHVYIKQEEMSFRWGPCIIHTRRRA